MANWTKTLREALFGKAGFLDGEVIINVPESLYLKELAVYSCVSLIANAISQCEILVYEKGKQVRNENWYSLNIKPNVNESAPQFWHKVTEKMLTAPTGKGALVFITNGNLYCADSYDIKEKRPFKAAGNLYENVVVDELTLNKVFNARDTMLFKLENSAASSTIANMYAELSGLVSAAFQHYKDANVQRWKFKINAREAGDEGFQREWQNKLKNAEKKFVSGAANVYVEYTGRELEPVALGSTAAANSASASDSISVIDKTLDMVARAYHIPPGILTAGNYNIDDLITQFLTFTIDPVADMIGKTITGAYGPEEFEKKNYFRVDTSKIKHFDIFGMAPNVDKLISSGFATVNEVRHAADWDYAGDPEDPHNWMNQHILTKNYEKEGGEKKNEGSKNVQLSFSENRGFL